MKAMTIYDLKSRFQDLLRPGCRFLISKNVTANQVTIFAIIISIVGGIIVYSSSGNRLLLLALPIVLFIRMALNAIDGMLAREFSMESKLGAVLNEVGDVISDVFLYLPLALLAEFQPIFVVVFVVLAIIVEMAGIISVQIGSSRRYDGPMG